MSERIGTGIRATVTLPDGSTVVQLDLRGLDSVWDCNAVFATFTQQQSRLGLPFGGCTIARDDLLPDPVEPGTVLSGPEAS